MRRLSDDPVLSHVKRAEVCMAVRQMKLDPRLHVRAAVTHIGLAELEAIRQAKGRSEFLPTVGIYYGRAVGLADAGQIDMGLAILHVDFEMDGCLERIEHLGHGAVEDVEMGGARCRGLAVQDLSQRVPLLGVRPLVDDDLLPAVAVGDLSGPLHQHDIVETVEAGSVELALTRCDRLRWPRSARASSEN